MCVTHRGVKRRESFLTTQLFVGAIDAHGNSFGTIKFACVFLVFIDSSRVHISYLSSLDFLYAPNLSDVWIVAV